MSGIEAESLDPQLAAERLTSLLLEEIYRQISPEELKDRNPHLTEDILIQRYVSFLKRYKDPRAKEIKQILELGVGKNRVDNVLSSVTEESELREQVRQSLIHGGVELDTAEGNKIPPVLLADLTNHLRSFDKEDLLLEISVKETPKPLQQAAFVSLAINLTLMMGQRSSTAEELSSSVKDQISWVADIPMGTVTDVTTAIVVGLYLLEGGIKISDVGFKRYLRDNKFDAVLNGMGIADLGIMASGSHEAYGAVARGFRALRGLKFFTKIKTVRDMLEALKEAGPALGNLGTMYVGLSSIITLMLVELLGSNAEEFRDMESAFSQMLNLFYGDGFQDVMATIDESASDNMVKRLAAKTGVLGYMGMSVIGAIGVFQAIIINQVIGTDKVERMVSFMSEKMSEGFAETKKILSEMVQMLQELIDSKNKTSEELGALREEVEGLREQISTLEGTVGKFSGNN